MIKIKKVILVLLNILIVFIVATTDWADWGALVMGPMVFGIAVILIPIVTLILYRKDNKKVKYALINLLISIFVLLSSRFVLNYDNIQNIYLNLKDVQEKSEIINNSSNLKITSTISADIYLDINNKDLIFVLKEADVTHTALNMVERSRLLRKFPLIETNMTEDEFNKGNIFSKTFYSNITFNIKEASYPEYNNLYIKIKDQIYTIDITSGYYSEIVDIAETDLIPKRILTISGIESYEVGQKNPYTWYEIYSNEDLDNITMKGTRDNRYDKYKFYKTLAQGKNDEDRLREYLTNRESLYGFVSPERKQIYNINSDKINKVIVYDFGNYMCYMEIITNNNSSIFMEISNIPVTNRTISK